MRKLASLAAALVLTALVTAPSLTSALTPAQQACIKGCIGRFRSCSLNCLVTGNCAICETQENACRKACLS